MAKALYNKMRVNEIIHLIRESLGTYEESDKDNNRLLFGKEENKIKNIYFCWRLTLNMLKKMKLDTSILIICHEPVLYDIKYSLTPARDNNIFKSNKEKVELISSHGVNIARFHLSLDSSPYGTNATLIKKLDLIEKKHFDYFSICELKKSENAINFITKIKNVLKTPFVNVTGNTNKTLKRVLLIAGGGANKEFLSFALVNKCDALISGDSYMESKYFAFENDILLIDPGHQSLEIPGIKTFAEIIKHNTRNKDIKVHFLNNEEIESIW